MPDWLRDVASANGELSPQIIAVRLIVAAVMGLIVACIYHASQRRQIGESFSFFVTMVLLTILVAMTTMVIGNSVARAFSLVGALSIVRFRTVVDDTRDTAFVIFAVVVGMAVGAGIIEVYLVGVPVVAVTATCLNFIGRGLQIPNNDRRLEIRVEGGIDSDALLSGIFSQQLSSQRLTAVATAKQGAAIDLVYSVRLLRPESSLQFVRSLAQLEGVQSVELK
ncbi:MAG: DUF4956 domain-containing protein [Planctomycetes bacterium]|nr:DUF4956 domain-containing protein [Planctomycetota bacterium]